MLTNGLPCGGDVVPGQELCQSHRGLERESERIDEWLANALNHLEGCEPDDDRGQRVRDAIVEAVGHLARMQRRKVAPLRTAGDVLMYAVTGQAPKLPVKADSMAKEWGNSGA